MTVLTASDTFSVGDTAPRAVETVPVIVVSAPTAPGGTGRLHHPVFGTYDYEIAPDEWTNLDSDIIYSPIWSHTQTLDGVASTRWAGYMKDVEVSERWVGAVAMKAGQLRMFLDFWMNPPATGELVPQRISKSSGFPVSRGLTSIQQGSETCDPLNAWPFTDFDHGRTM